MSGPGDKEALAKAVAIFIVIPILFYFLLLALARRLVAPLLLVVLGVAFAGCSGKAADPVVRDGALRGAAIIGSEAKCPGPRTQKNIDRTTAEVDSLQNLIKRLAAPR